MFLNYTVSGGLQGSNLYKFAKPFFRGYILVPVYEVAMAIFGAFFGVFVVWLNNKNCLQFLLQSLGLKCIFINRAPLKIVIVQW